MPDLLSVLSHNPSPQNTPDNILTTLTTFLPFPSLLSLRACHPTLTHLLTPYNITIFHTLHLTLSTTCFSPASLSALSRIGHNCTHLLIHLHHSGQTRIHLLPRSPTDPTRLSPLVPLPRDGYFDGETGAFTLPEQHRHVCDPADPELFTEAIRVRGWVRVFAALEQRMRELTICVTGTPPQGRGLERGVVDEALISIRHVLETRRCLVRRFEYSGHARGVWVLDPMVGWEGRGVRRAWWARVGSLSLKISEGSVERFEGWEKETVGRALCEMVEEMSEGLVELEVEAAGLESPFVSEGVEFPKLVELKVAGLVMSWGGLRGFLNERARNVMRFTVVRDVGFVEGDQGWKGMYREWELENIPKTERGPFILRRKDTFMQEEWA
ncbi:hypothetical protein K440DRAFT_646328 [Wilcoxina mikolae CBS 423.85]|nr:hypothetical protein K440DRAFT_646328 [Wilcoxina mikolae CBS 423.85]